MKRIIAEDSPALLAFDENAWIDRLDSNAMPVDEAVALFEANRKWMARISEGPGTMRPISPGRANHTEKGRQTLAEVLAYATNHLDHHLKFLYAKRAKLGMSRFTLDTRANTEV